MTVSRHPPFLPGLCVLPVAARAPTLVLPTGDGLLAVALSDAGADAAPSHAAPDESQPDGLCFTPVRWAAAAERDEPAPEEPEDVAAAASPPPPRGTRLRARVAARFDAEKYISRVCASAMASGLRLVDYTLQLVLTQAAPVPAHGAAAVLLLVAALRPSCCETHGGGAPGALRTLEAELLAAPPGAGALPAGARSNALQRRAVRR